MPSESPSNEPSAVTTPFERVIAVCESFSQDYSAGPRPSIEAFLDLVAEDAQPTLLRNLLAVELANRRASGEQPTLDEYVNRFPSFAALVREVFLEQSSLAMSVPGELTKSKLVSQKSSALSRLGEYRLLGQLGRGGMGVVYEAVHVQRGNRVALKTLPTLDGAALHRFKREFRSLADSNHPNLIGLHTLEADGNQWFFTMDLIEGMTFLKYVRPNNTLDETRLRSALSQLVTGIMALHGRHIIHRDLKPSNVMVTHDGQVIVLDFGLVLELENVRFNSLTSDKIAGTPRYMAPEQAAGGKVTSASDWYALGVMLYEAFTGAAPFNGETSKVLWDKQRLRAPPLPADANTPEDLAQLCLRLLATEPEQRPDALEIAKAISSNAPSVTATRASTDHQLVGREQQLAALREISQKLQRQREPLTVFVSGRSGEGKSTLAEHFLTPLRSDQRFAVMSGRCYDRESVPFKALDSLIDSLSSYLRSIPANEAALLIPDDIGALALMFPVLQRVEVVAEATDSRLNSLDEQQIRGRAFRALRALLSRVSRKRLILWFIDDLQWGDADSAEALFEVLRPPEAPAVLFLGAYRSDETEGSAFLNKWKELGRAHDVQFLDQEIKVSPLSEQQCTQLVIELLGRDDEVVRRRALELAQETRGNPFLLIELLGCFDPETDSFKPLPLHEALAKKLARLPAEAGLLLEVVAISGQPLSLEEASRTAGHELMPVATFTRMRNERLIRIVGPEDRPLIDTYHDRVRESVLGQIDEARGQSLHKALAHIIELAAGDAAVTILSTLQNEERRSENGVQKSIPRVFDLAYHFDAAGEKQKAWRYALIAAEQARRQSSLDAAAQQYAIAKRNAIGQPKAVYYRIAEGYGEVLMLLGRYPEADAELQGAVDLTESAENKARIDLLNADNCFKQGAVEKSFTSYKSGLQRLGQWVPQSKLGLVWGIACESLIQLHHSLFPNLLHRRTATSRDDLVIRLFVKTMNPSIFHSTFAMLWCHLAGVNRAELFPPSPSLAFSYTVHGLVMTMTGWRQRGATYFDRAAALVRQFDDALVRGYTYGYHGISLYFSARYEESLLRLTEAVECFEKAGDRWEVNLGHFHKGCCYYGLGRLTEAVAEAQTSFNAAARLGDSRVLCSSWIWARAAKNAWPFEYLKPQFPNRPDDVMSTVHGVLAEGYWHTSAGRTADALQAYERAATMVRKSFCVNSHMILVIPMLAMGLRLRADAIEASEPKQADRLRTRAHRAAKWASRLSVLFPASAPLAWRERALIFAALGKKKQALQFADKSCSIAKGQSAQYEYAQSLLVRGKLAKELGLPEADAQIRLATTTLQAIEQPVMNAANAAAPLSTQVTQSIAQEHREPRAPAKSTSPPASRHNLVRTTGSLLALIATIFIGGIIGACIGYLCGFLSGLAADEMLAWKAAGVRVGAMLGFGLGPILALWSWTLVRSGQRHYESEIKRNPGAAPSRPPIWVRYGILVVVVVLGLCLSALPAALGIWLFT